MTAPHPPRSQYTSMNFKTKDTVFIAPHVSGSCANTLLHAIPEQLQIHKKDKPHTAYRVSPKLPMSGLG